MTLKQRYQAMVSAAQKLLGIDTLPVKDAKLDLTADQRATLVAALDEDKVKAFENAFNQFNSEDANANAAFKNAMEEFQRLLQEEQKTTAQLQQQVETLSRQPEQQPAPVAATTPKANGKFLAHQANAKHLFGLEDPLLSLDENREWNQRAAQHLLRLQGISMPAPEGNINYDQLANDFNKVYQTRTDIRTLLTVGSQFDSIFPMRSGVSDKAVGFNLFLDELTQSYQQNFVTKGAFAFEPEVQAVFDLEFAYEFRNLKELERNWIGTLTGAAADSSPMKLSFVNFLYDHIAKKIIMERDRRTANGRYKAPVQGTPGSAINGADGVYEVINDKIAELKVRVTPVGLITDSNIDLKYKQIAESVPQELRDAGTMIMYIPTGKKRKYNDALNARYGSSRPNREDIDYIDGYPMIKLMELPFSEGRMRAFITIAGNIERLENKPGEAFSGMRMVPQIKTLQVNSVWKEGVIVNLAGRKAANANALAVRPLTEQAIWCNEIDFDPNFYVAMEKDDATPSVGDHTSIVSMDNTAPVAITNIDDAPVGAEIRIKNGSATNGITIANTGNFSLLGSAWNPNLGDILVLKKRSDGKFIELDRIDAITDGYIQLAAGATTPDVSAAQNFLTAANAGATAITNLVNAVPGLVYTIRGGSSTNATTIANSGNFVLTTGITLNAGVWIQLQKSDTDGKFYEIQRG
jgi:hypothetical protein